MRPHQPDLPPLPEGRRQLQDFLAVPAAFEQSAGKGDALCGLDEGGELHRVRSSDGDTVIALLEPELTKFVATEGTHVYVTSGQNADGALSRVIE